MKSDKDIFLTGLLSEIAAVESSVRQQSRELLLLKNRFLSESGWEVSSEIIGPTESYFYRKDSVTYICEDDAIEQELHSKAGANV